MRAQRRPIDPLAVDVVFDALAQSKSGILQRELCDSRRASYATASGAFDAGEFSAALGRGRLTVVRSFCIFPGSVMGLQAGLFYKLNGMESLMDYLRDSQEKLFGAALF